MADTSIDFIGRRRQTIPAELREMKFAAEVERRNGRSAFDNLVIEVGAKLGTFETTIEHRLGAMDERLGATGRAAREHAATARPEFRGAAKAARSGSAIADVAGRAVITP